MTGTEKAAIIMLSLGESKAAEILRYLPNETVTRVMNEVTNLGADKGITADQQVAVIKETITLLETYNEIIEGGWDKARAILEQAYGATRALDVMRHLTVTSHRFVRPFQRLNQQEARQLLQLLGNEHPQVGALVLGQIDSALAAAVLTLMPKELAAEITRRLTRPIKVPPQYLMIIEEVLTNELKVTDTSEVAGGIDAVVPIMNRMETSTERAIIDSIAQTDQPLADLIASQLFTFEDMQVLDDQGVQLILRQIEPGTMALALRSASPKLRDKVMGNLSEHAREIMEDHMLGHQKVRVRDVEKAQREVITLIHSLEEQGELVIPRDGSDEFIE